MIPLSLNECKSMLMQAFIILGDSYIENNHMRKAHAFDMLDTAAEHLRRYIDIAELKRSIRGIRKEAGGFSLLLPFLNMEPAEDIVIASIKGGLGNQLFQYATARSMTKKIKGKLLLDVSEYKRRIERENYRPYSLQEFDIKADVYEGRSFMYLPILTDLLNNKIKDSRKIRVFNQEVITRHKGCHLIGCWESFRYFEEHRDLLLGDMCIKNPSNGFKKISFKIEKENSVCLHVRRTDFMRRRRPVMPMAYYIEAIKCLGDHVNKVFHIFSDDMAWCVEALEPCLKGVFPGIKTELSGSLEISDSEMLISMSKCRYFIIPCSTFGWWAAWLSVSEGKIVICPDLWCAGKHIRVKIKPKEWLTVSTGLL